MPKFLYCSLFKVIARPGHDPGTFPIIHRDAITNRAKYQKDLCIKKGTQDNA